MNPGEPASSPPAATLPVPLLASAAQAAALCGLSVRTWWRLDSSGRIPKAVLLGGSKKWRRSELEAWTAAGCPPRTEWRWPKVGA